MRKYLLRFLLILFLILLLAGVYILYRALPVATGFGAKTVCTCAFVMNRSIDSTRAKELKVFPGLSSANVQLRPDSSATVRFLWSESKAIYRKGLGCTLLSERPEAEVRNQTILLPPVLSYNPDTIPWPMGNQLNNDINYRAYARIRSLVDSAFRNDDEKPWNTHAMIVVHDGNIIAEQYAEGFSATSRMAGWSMAKSITSALIGILIREEEIILLDPAPVAQWAGDDRRNISIEHLLQATSGLEWNESYFNPFSDFHEMFIARDDKGGYAASLKLKHQPGMTFQYSSGTSNILSKIVRQTVGDSAYYQFPYRKLFHKTGMTSMLLEPDASGTFVGSSYAYGTARDWARFGLLYLNDGYWLGERILPETWVEYTTTPSLAAPRGEYGGHWWLNSGNPDNRANRLYPNLPSDAFSAEGFEEQYLMVIPSLNLVIVRLGVSHHGFPFEKFVAGIIEALPSAQ